MFNIPLRNSMNVPLQKSVKIIKTEIRFRIHTSTRKWLWGTSSWAIWSWPCSRDKSWWNLEAVLLPCVSEWTEKADKLNMLLPLTHFYQCIIPAQLLHSKIFVCFFGWDQLRRTTETDSSEKSYLDTKQLSIFVGNKTILSKHVVQFLDNCTQTDGQP